MGENTKVGKNVKRGGVTRRFDWVPSTHQAQNANYRLKGLDCYSQTKKRRGIRRKQPLRLDQGTEGACTGFGMAHVLAATPIKRVDLAARQARDLYYQARKEDEWPGEAYDGSSINGVMHAARTLGYLREWRWIETPAELRHALSYHGAVEAGSNWTEGMWDTDENGYINATGNKIGGHAYCVSGFRPSPTRKGSIDYWINNSWGPDWGIDGGCWITDTDAHALWFGTGGEIAIPIR